MANPQTLQQAQKEVDEVLGSGPIKVEHLSKLPYITACLRETLRLTPTIPGTTVGPLPDTKEDPVIIGGGKYLVKPGSRLTMVLSKVHKDPKVYGDDADKFRPERMLDEHFNKLPKNAWKVSSFRIAGHVTMWLILVSASRLETVLEHVSVEVLHGKKLC